MTKKLILQRQLLRLHEVLEIIPVSRTSFYEGIKLDIYPKPIRLGKRTVAWDLDEIRQRIARLQGAGISV